MTNKTAERIYINKPSITDKEIAYVNDAIANGWGEKCYDYIFRFEDLFRKHVGTRHALATSSCTGAIHLALMAMGVKQGDEVIVPEITWIATVEPVLYIGAKPVFVDVLRESWCIDPEKLEKAITKKTRAIIVVHVYGNVCDMDAIMAIADKHGIQVLEDAAEGIGSEHKGRKTGSIAKAGVFSFHGTKTLSTGEGGMFVTNDTGLYEKAKVLNDHGRNPKDPENKLFWMRNYGYKYKISNLQAAMGCAQTERIDELIKRKREIFNSYHELLKDVPCIMNPEPQGTRNGYWLPTVVFDKAVNFNREELFNFHKSIGIDSRPFFYPLSSLPMFDTNEGNDVSFDTYKRGVNLPSYHDISEDQITRVGESIKDYLLQVCR